MKTAIIGTARTDIALAPCQEDAENARLYSSLKYGHSHYQIQRASWRLAGFFLIMEGKAVHSEGPAMKKLTGFSRWRSWPA